MSTNTGKGMGRRSFLTVAVGGAALAAPLAGWVVQRATGPGATASTESAEVDRFFADLRPGTQINQWTVESVHPVHLGGVPVVLSSANGHRFQVDVLKRDSSISGVADTHEFSVFISNSGNGSTATREEDGLGAMALARELLRMEGTRQAPELLTIRERHTRFPSGNFRVLS